ncbi:MAG TPA: hypothetical protein VFZ00_11170 [Solirubrobacter sp.]|nr:hypothetical protein [Solirubrobacter sp.]
MDDREHPLTALRSDLEIVSVLGDVQIDGLGGLKTLPAAAFALDGGDADMKAQRGEMITAIRGGKHAELSVNAITWRQRPAPNRRYLRLATDKLADRAGSWKGKPLLIDHATYTVKSAMGTILSSKLLEESAKVAAFEQQLSVVKPDAVIGFLDGTMRTFSIGWYALGPVMCSVHGLDVTGPDSCCCWPGETVTLDGKSKIVEYEFSDYEGKETSIVVSPAVRDTSVEGIRAALSAELHLHPSRPPKESKKMAIAPKLAAALRLSADADDDSAVTAVMTLQQRAVTAELELATASREVTRLTGEVTRLTKEVEVAGAAALDGIIEGAYKSGRLAYGKDAEGKNTPDPMESLLRDFGTLKGRKELEGKLAAMQPRVPVGVPPVATTTTEAPKTTLRAVPTDEQIRDTALQCGVPENQLRAEYGLAPIGGAA